MPEKTCLLVDDEEMVRSFVRALLKRDHFGVIEARNGIEAAQIVEQSGDAIDLIVSDVQMPGMDGITFARLVRKSYPALPIILISGYIAPTLPELPDGSFEFVPKPFQLPALRSAIGKAITTMELRKGATTPSASDSN